MGEKRRDTDVVVWMVEPPWSRSPGSFPAKKAAAATAGAVELARKYKIASKIIKMSM